MLLFRLVRESSRREGPGREIWVFLQHLYMGGRPVLKA